jgi:outer membrane protein assembly factor BamA
MSRRWGSGRSRWLAVASSMVLASATTLAAQDVERTEARQTEDTKKDKEGGLRGWIDKRVRSFTKTSEREKGITPLFGTVTPGSGLAGGAGYKHFNAFGPGFGYEVGGMVSFRRYQEYFAAIGRLNARSSTVELDTADRRVGSLFNDSSTKKPGSALYVEARYRDYPQSIYYGSGTASLKTNRADYSLSGVSVEGVWQRQFEFDSSLGISVRGGLLDLRVGTGTNNALVNFEERFAAATIPGGLEQPRFITLGAGLVRDTRRHPGAPDDGTFIGVGVRRFTADAAADLDFTRTTFDIRAYAQPITARGVIAVRALLSSDFTDSGRQTPFYLQQSLGGGDTIRGLPSYRFQDQALYVLSAEYRWRAHRYVEVAPFVDVGNAASALSRLTFDSLKVGPGVALRLRTDHRTLVRLEWATSSEGYRIVVGTGPSF